MSVILAEQKNPALFSMVVWTIWHQRNNCWLGIRSVVALSNSGASKGEGNHTSPPTTTPASCWRPPDQDYVKINFDGALFSKENQAGIGVVIRNEAGLVLASLS